MNSVTIFEDWDEDINGTIWYKWKLPHEKEWSYIKTAYRQKPIIHSKWLSQYEYEELRNRDTIPETTDADGVRSEKSRQANKPAKSKLANRGK